MAIETKTHVDFEPYCEWKKDEGAETLIVHLPGMLPPLEIIIQYQTASPS